MKTSAEDIVAAARMCVYQRHPYLSAALFALRPCPAPGLGTLAVDAGWRLYYDPKTVLEWHEEMQRGLVDRVGGKKGGHDGVAAVVFHELGHVLREHHRRLGDRNPSAWNESCDREINDTVEEAGWVLPGKPLMPADIDMDDGLLAEEYYRSASSVCHGMTVSMRPGSGAPCGGCSGNPTPWEKANMSKEMDGTPSSSLAPGEGALPSPLSDMEQEIILRKTALAIQEHAKGRGTVPSGLRAWADAKLMPPKIDWRQKVRAATRSGIAAVAGASDWTWQRSGRRALHSAGRAGWPLAPAFFQPRIRTCIVVDCSGSMLGEKLVEAIGEVQGILRAAGDVDFLTLDAEVQEYGHVSTLQQAISKLKGCGGTSFVPAFEFLTRKKNRPDLVIFFTDGWGDAPDKSPPFRVIWGLIGDGAKQPSTWGQGIEIESGH